MTIYGTVVLALALSGPGVLTAAESMEAQKARVQRIEDAVLAPCCYTQPLSLHQSEIAVKMRLEIKKWVAEGKTDDEIFGAFVLEYGSKVLVNPRSIPGWWTPWIPWLALLLGAVFLTWLLMRWHSKQPAAAALPGSDAVALPDLEDDD